MSSTMHVHLLGKATLLDTNQSLVTLPAKAQELFYYLLLYNVYPHERENLCTLLWAEQSAERAKKYLRQALWHLQGALNDQNTDQSSILELDGNWVHLKSNSSIWVDAHKLLGAFEAVRDIPGTHLSSAQVGNIKHAIDLYQGELLTGWYQDWCILERERYQSMVLALLDKLIDHALHNDRYADGIDYARQILHIDCAREQTHRALMRLHYLANDRSAALRQFERCTNALMSELSVKPAKRTINLYQQLQSDQFDNQWAAHRNRRIDLPSTVPEAEPVRQNDPPFLATLGHIRQLLSTMHQDIVTIKRALEL